MCGEGGLDLSLRSDDGGRPEEESVVGLVVVQVGGVEDDPLEADIVLADVDRRPGDVLATPVARQHRCQPCGESSVRATPLMTPGHVTSPHGADG